MLDVQTLIPRTADPRVGDPVLLRCDVLAETARPTSGIPQIWRYLPAGTRGRLIGWRERDREPARAVVDIAGSPRRLVVFVGERHVARAPGH